MKATVKRIAVFMLSAAMFLSDNSVAVFASEYDENQTESILLEEDSTAIEIDSAEEIIEAEMPAEDLSVDEEIQSIEENFEEASMFDEELQLNADGDPVIIEQFFWGVIDSGNAYEVQGVAGGIYNDVSTATLVLPSECSGKPVKSIGLDAFYHWKQIFVGELVIPDSITNIGIRAFKGCSGFTGKLSIPDGVATIGDEAFAGCTGLSSIELSHTTKLGKDVFDGCNAEIKYRGTDYTLKYSISDGNATVTGYDGALVGKLVIPDNYTKDSTDYPITVIGKDAFNGSSMFSPVVWGKNVKRIEEGAFSNVTGLEIGILPDNLEYIGAHAFDSNITDEYLTIPNNVEFIGDYAFAGCSNLKEVIVPEATTIGEGAFPAGCTVTKKRNYDFTTDELSDGTLKIVCFTYDSEYPKDLVIPDRINGKTVTQIGAHAFSGRDQYLWNDTMTGTLTLPNTLKEIGYGAFGNCKFTGELYIPDSVEKIAAIAFTNCAGFTSISVKSRALVQDQTIFEGCSCEPVYRTANSYEFKYTVSENQATVTGFFGEIKGDLVIPDTLDGYQVVAIGDNAFDAADIGGTLIEGNLILPGTLKRIGKKAFRSNTKMKGTIDLPEGLEEIGDEAFKDNISLTGDLVIPGSVKSIGEKAFYGCEGMKGTLTLSEGENALSIGYYAFGECGFTGTVVIPVRTESIASEVFYCCQNITRIENKSAAYVPKLPNILNTGICWYRVDTGLRIPNDELDLPPYTSAYRVDYESLFYEGIVSEGYTYTGAAIKPQIKVFDRTKQEIDASGYSVSYKNNTKAYTLKEGDSGFSAKNAPTITVTMKGNYSGKKVFYFTINPKDISDADVVIGDISTVIESSKTVKPVPTVTYKNKKLKNNTDYTVAYYDTAACDGTPVTPKEAGEYYIKITGTGENYTGSKIEAFTISPQARKLVSKLTVGKIPNQRFTGEKIGSLDLIKIKDGKTPVTVGLKGVTPAADCDVFVSFANNRDVGTATVLIEGTGAEGAKYVGSRKVPFTITQLIPMSKIRIEGFSSSEIYTGKPIKQSDLKFYAVIDGVEREVLWIDKEAYDVASDDARRGYGLVVSYTKNTDKGTATMILTGINGLSGTVKKKFAIKANDLNNIVGSVGIYNSFTGGTQQLCEYSKAGVKPELVVTLNNGTKLRNGKDYTVSYYNNKATWVPGDSEKKRPYAKITGKGNYKGTMYYYFQICEKTLLSSDIELNATDKEYKNAPGNWKTTVNLTDNGKKLKQGTDYTIEYTYHADTPVIDGSKKSRPSIERAAGAKVEATDIVPAGTIIVVKALAKDGGNYRGDKSTTYHIVKQDISKLKVSVKSKLYTGEEICIGKGDITFTNNKYGDVDYEILGNTYKNNTNIGKATVVIRGMGNYGGTKTVSFNIAKRKILWWYI